jgi:two-component system response regulator PilR (NtrC family)
MSLVPTSNKLHAVIVDADTPARNALEQFLRGRGHAVASFSSATDALRYIREETESLDLVLVDPALTGGSAPEILLAVKGRRTAQTVMLPTFASLDAAIESMRQGAFDYVVKPFKMTQIEVLLTKVLSQRQLREENAKLSERVQSLYDRLDHLKDNRDRMDRSLRDTFDKLDYHGEMLEECLSILRKKSG